MIRGHGVKSFRTCIIVCLLQRYWLFAKKHCYRVAIGQFSSDWPGWSSRTVIAYTRCHNIAYIRCKCNASVNSSCAHPPPGQLRGICVPCQSRGWGISKFGTARGSGICLPPGYWHAHVVSDSKSKHGGFYRKGPVVRRRLDRLPRTGQTCGVFLDFMHFFIAHQGTTIT